MAAGSLLVVALIIFAGAGTHFTFISFLVLALCAYFPFGWLLLAPLSVKQRYNRDRDKFIDHTVTFTHESVSSTSTTADHRIAWDQFASIIVTPRGLLFLLPPHNVWFWLPQRLFDGNTLKETILELATEHKVSIRRMA